MFQDVRQKFNSVRGELAQYFDSSGRCISASVEVELAAHASRFVGHLLSGHAGGAFLDELNQQIGNPHLIGVFVSVSESDIGADTHQGNGAVLRERNLHAVFERESLTGRNSKRLGRTERRSGFSFLGD